MSRGAPASEGAEARLEVEAGFWRGYLRPELERRPDLLLLAVSLDDEDLEGTLSHEVKHVQLARSREYASVVREYWFEVLTREERALARLILGSFYDPDDERLMIDEWQAYLLASNAGAQLLSDQVPGHAASLRELLALAGVVLLEME